MHTRIIDLFLIDLDAEPDENWLPDKYLRTRVELCFRLEDERVFQQTVNCEKQDVLIYLNRALHFFALGRLRYNDEKKEIIVTPPSKVGEWVAHKRMMEKITQQEEPPF